MIIIRMTLIGMALVRLILIVMTLMRVTIIGMALFMYNNNQNDIIMTHIRMTRKNDAHKNDMEE